MSLNSSSFSSSDFPPSHLNPRLPLPPSNNPPSNPPSQQPPQLPTNPNNSSMNGILRGGGNTSSSNSSTNGSGGGPVGGIGSGQNQQQQNGGGGWPGLQGAGGAPTNVGEQMDMNVLWELVNNLAEVHQGIREQTQGVLQRVNEVQARQDSVDGPGGSFTNGQHGGPQEQGLQNSQAAEIAALRTALRNSETHAELVTLRNHAAWGMVTEHENSLSHLLTKLRPFALSHSHALSAQKAHYLSLLDAERTANLELRLEIARLQDGLGRALDSARSAMKEGEKRGRVWRRKVAALKAENKVLSGICGVRVQEGSEDSEWSEEERDMEDIEEGSGNGRFVITMSGQEI